VPGRSPDQPHPGTLKRRLYERGERHPTAFFPSSLHRKLELASLDLKENLAWPLASSRPGPLVILVSGRVVSAPGGGGGGTSESTAMPQILPASAPVRMYS
jgi:hypothetical protein